MDDEPWRLGKSSGLVPEVSLRMLYILTGE